MGSRQAGRHPAREELPAPAGDKDDPLWLFDSAYPDPADGDIFAVNPETGHTQISFQPAPRVNNAVNFAISFERQGGAPKNGHPVVVIRE